MSHPERVLRSVKTCAGRTNFMWLELDARKEVRLCFDGSQGSVNYRFPGVVEVVSKLESSGEFAKRPKSATVCWDRNRNTGL
ncbi:hypothetical protein LCGC14_2824440 [marine sediment metagenome]|uniref:Uncharacterized protein n=1 Tax=marine sediment metagenome TaxID=412755 RepID=A0A0F8YG06_9ZZZZ